MSAGANDLFDPELLARTRMQWHFGEWQTLAALDEDQLSEHPDRAQLAMLICAARQQLGDRLGGERALSRVEEWGGDRQALVRLLVAGTHNTLARASILLGLPEDRVHSHFANAVVAVGGDHKLASGVRSHAESSALARQLAARGGVAEEQAASPGKGSFVRQLAVHDLGSGWAGNTVNTAIFRHHGLLSDGGYQFTAFYVDETRARFVRRDLKSGEIRSFDLEGQFDIRDAHNGINFGIDRAGHLHVSYDHHVDALRYRRSLRPWCIDAWSDEMPMTGKHEEHVTYPSFIQRPNALSDAPLLMLYRDGVSDSGSARVKEFDEATARWSDRPLPILSGARQRPWTSNAYWNHPVRGRDGSLHLSFVWRTHSIGEERRVNNINVGYARSIDDGLSWLTSHGRPYRLPITQVNAETAVAISPGNNLINQNGMALDSRQRPHVVFYSNDDAGVPQIQHAWLEGAQWKRQIVSSRINPFELAGRGTLQIPISRPDIVIDRADNVFVIHRSDDHGDRMVVTRLAAPDYQYSASQTQVLWHGDIGYCEPIIDRLRWQNEGILTMFLQCSDQPHGDLDHEQRATPVLLLDLELT